MIEWKKSSRSTYDGNCVEVAHVDDEVWLRNSRRPAPLPFVRLQFTRAEWAAFLEGVKAGEFDDEPA